MKMLKTIFFRNNHKNHNNLFQVELDGFLLQQEHFLARMRQEWLRSERSGLPLSIVIIDVNGVLGFLAQMNGAAARPFLRNLASVLKHSTRESDVKGWYKAGKIALLAPDTSEFGAEVLAKNLTGNLLSNSHIIPHFREKDLRRFISFSTLDNGIERPPAPPQDTTGDNLKDSALDRREKDHRNSSRMTGMSDKLFSLKTHKTHHEIIKRILDIVMALTLMFLSSPILLISSLLVKLDSPGPILYKQRRVGKKGKKFSFYKFRSMHHNCDQSIHQQHIANLMCKTAGLSCIGNNGETSYKIIDDSRITRFGRFLRNTSIDELPQLINVLKGDMSLVGPRPHPVYEVDLYYSWHRHRLQVKPGITGLGQISGRYNRDYEDVFRLDCQYLKQASLFQDLKILFKTIPAVLVRRGAV
jgi:lipopolysaccharide/colanic/teichoic acid biosynthesis glycosyltransferase